MEAHQVTNIKVDGQLIHILAKVGKCNVLSFNTMNIKKTNNCGVFQHGNQFGDTINFKREYKVQSVMLQTWATTKRGKQTSHVSALTWIFLFSFIDYVVPWYV